MVVTRGAIETPEQETPNKSLPSPWEACYTFGDQWQYRPTNEDYKSANDVIQKTDRDQGKRRELPVELRA